MAYLRWGVLGAARIASKQMIPAVRRSGVGEVVAVSSASGRGAEFAAAHGIASSHAEHEALLTDPQVDAVYIALPNSEHARWVARAVAAGKHVLCEKPITLGAEQLRELFAAGRDAGVHVAEAFMYRHHAQLARTRELLAQAAIGDIVTLDARFHFTQERGPEPGIRLRADLGGGVLNDLGCYPVDLFGLLLGTEPQGVTALAAGLVEGGAETRVAATLRYGEVLATMDASFDAPVCNELTIRGTLGTMRLPAVFRADDAPGPIEVTTPGEVRTWHIDGDQYAAQVRRFTTRVQAGPPSAADEDQAASLRTAATLDRVAAAAGLTTRAADS